MPLNKIPNQLINLLYLRIIHRLSDIEILV